MFIIYVALAKILNRQLIYPKNVINKAVYQLSANIYLNKSYKFKIIPIGFTSAKNKDIFDPKFTLPWQQCQMVSYRTKNSILENCIFFSVKVYMSTTCNVKITDICFPRMENKKVQYYKFMLVWQQNHHTVLNLPKPSF